MAAVYVANILANNYTGTQQHYDSPGGYLSAKLKIQLWNGLQQIPREISGHLEMLTS